MSPDIVVNSCFVPLLGGLSFAEIKRRLKITASTRQINEMIKSRLAREAEQNLKSMVA
jgi:hypothetical protein